ncbi:hypothetical protein FRC18_001721 [Serendipita sp. 400]|nr:hypothetical protein FRC18_001721 [Serendipita sp. 400]
MIRWVIRKTKDWVLGVDRSSQTYPHWLHSMIEGGTHVVVVEDTAVVVELVVGVLVGVLVGVVLLGVLVLVDETQYMHYACAARSASGRTGVTHPTTVRSEGYHASR